MGIANNKNIYSFKLKKQLIFCALHLINNDVKCRLLKHSGTYIIIDELEFVVANV